ncbi:MAG: hypothetical protein ABSA51_02910 [Anaerolineaceae bacterium]|jgi:hypothetical protein
MTVGAAGVGSIVAAVAVTGVGANVIVVGAQAASRMTNGIANLHRFVLSDRAFLSNIIQSP